MENFWFDSGPDIQDFEWTAAQHRGKAEHHHHFHVFEQHNFIVYWVYIVIHRSTHTYMSICYIFKTVLWCQAENSNCLEFTSTPPQPSSLAHLGKDSVHSHHLAVTTLCFDNRTFKCLLPLWIPGVRLMYIIDYPLPGPQLELLR